MNQEPSFGHIVKDRRKELGLTQTELAGRVGCAPVTLRKIEYNALRPSTQMAEQLAVALQIPETEHLAFVRLARRERDPSPIPPLPPAPEEIGQEDLSGRSIKGFELGERIGEGGYGAVYRAVQATVERDVAIKIILPKYADRPEFIRRFEAEAHLVARLEHPHIVPLYDYWREPGVAYLVMRFLRGGSLDTRLKQAPLAPDTLLPLLEQICAGLHAAHQTGVIHRDIKPANILLDEDGNAYLADFGIAKNLTEINGGVTSGEMVIGSPAYISPEQIMAEPIKPQTDIYSLGVMLYELLTGHKPFKGPTPVAYIQQHLNEQLPLLAAAPQTSKVSKTFEVSSQSTIPTPLDIVIGRATSKDPQERYPDILSMLADLRQAMKPDSTVADITDNRPDRITPPHIAAMIDLPDLENPYKGLRAFSEADAADFFGRQALIQTLLIRMAEENDLSRFLAVVGASGSGKSSVVRAGLIPALRQGGLPDSDKWFMVEMIPGAHPLEELEAALLRVAVNPPDSLLTQLRESERGLHRAVKRILPPDRDIELMLVIDQFEELFTLVEDEATRAHFLDSLLTAVLDPGSRLRVVITLRADFTDRPLHYVDFGELVRRQSEFVLPLTPDELEQAISGPTKRAGLALESGLVATIIDDIGDQPGMLPLLQYALTELFERRQGRKLTLAAYQDSGGVLGALARRADELYADLDEVEQEATRQLFLRLVTLGEGTEDTRRRVLRSELTSLDGAGAQGSRGAEAQGRKGAEENATYYDLRTTKPEPISNLQSLISNPQSPISNLQSPISPVIDTFGRYRLLTFDHDPVTRGPTVEVAHEALLREWARLRGWLDESRADIRLQRLLASAAAEWLGADRDLGFLLREARLDQFEGWAANTDVALTQNEQAFLEASLTARQEREAKEAARLQRELEIAQKLAETEKQRAEEQSQAAGRLRWLAVGLAVFLLAAIAAAWFALNQRTVAQRNAAEAQNVALVAGSHAALTDGKTDEALVLAMQAVTLDPGSARAQAALSEAAYAPGTIRRFEGHTGGIFDIALSPDGRTALSASLDKTVMVWDIQTGQMIHRLEGHTEEVKAVAISPDGHTALSGSHDKTLILWDIQTGQIIRRFEGHTDHVWTVAMSPDGRTALSGGVGETLILWDIQTGQIIRHFEGHTDSVESVKFSPDGHTALSGSHDETMILWDIESGQIIRRFEGHSGGVLSVAFSPDGRRALSGGSEDDTIILWDIETGQIIHRLAAMTWVRDVTFSPDGQRALAGGDTSALTLWDLATGQLITRLRGHEFSMESVAFSPDGRTALTGSFDGTLRLWDLEGGQVIRRFSGFTGRGFVARNPTEPERTALIGGYDGANIWDLQTGNKIRHLPTSRRVPWVAYSPDGQTALGAIGEYEEEAGDVVLWDVETGQEIRRFVGHPAGVTTVAFSPDGQTAVSTGLQGAIILWDVATGQEIRRFRGHEADGPDGMAFTVDLSPDGRRLLTGFNRGKVVLWDVATGQEIRQLVGHIAVPDGVLFSPDGQHAFSAGWDTLAIYWDLTDGSIIHRLTDHSTAIYALALSPDGRFGMAGSDDFTTLWDLQTGEVIRRYPGLNEEIFNTSFSPDGREVIVLPADGNLAVWRIDATLDELVTWTRNNRYIPELTCRQRELYKLEPLCDEEATATSEAAETQ